MAHRQRQGGEWEHRQHREHPLHPGHPFRERRFRKAGEELFDDYWANYGKIELPDPSGKRKKLSSFEEYLRYRGLPESLNNPRARKRKGVPG